ncbi:MAG: aminotransferase class I/II-fold pyridoxal phosphate-dependent enzyme [Bacteroidales bacterium]|jgi:dTDP-4-amino-4,6-dideoxygalactose transaminase|nr:aminotransferase class I/II-fold pyridoxal phosphate-dependent enzyme [Bacteroidales bacterium]
MTIIKNELQSIILGNGQIGKTNKLKAVQTFLRRNENICYECSDKKFIKKEEEKQLLNFAFTQNFFFSGEISEDLFVAEGAEQRVYRYNEYQVIKTNSAFFYKTWLDYFNNLLIHNYFFSATAYEFLGFSVINSSLFAVVKQDFIAAREVTKINLVKCLLEYNGFSNTRNNDYYNPELGIIFEDLHDENVLSREQAFFFIDTVFYLTDNFFPTPIPFSPPRIDDKTIDAVTAALQSGWITTGPRVKEFEKRIAQYVSIEKVVCVNSASAGLELILRWFGVQKGDEVIVPAYTYCATANVVVHCGAKPVMVDVRAEDFNINIQNIEKAITKNTKVIIPVDFAGFPCDYDEISQLVNNENVKQKFIPRTEIQEKLGRILILSDAAHSIGATYKGKRTGALADITVFSFHAVKNLTTAEGGAICLNLSPVFNQDEIYKELCIKSLHGQSKDALSKSQIGNWRYDVCEAGYKCNMTDILAAIGLVELERYENDMLVKRKHIFDRYTEVFSKYERFEVPVYETDIKTSSYHVYPLRIKNITESERDTIIQQIAQYNISLNVHFIPLPMLSFYKSREYNIENFPIAYQNYAREISLPAYYGLTDEQVRRVIEVFSNI